MVNSSGIIFKGRRISKWALRLLISLILLPGGLLTLQVIGQEIIIPNETTTKKDSLEVAKKDTIRDLRMTSYPVSEPWARSPFFAPDISLIRHYDPTQMPGQLRRVRLNNIGTASVAIQPQNPQRIGFSLGLQAWSPYMLPADSLLLIRSAEAYTEVSYIQGPTTEDGIFKGTFARKFGKRTDFKMEALRIFHQGEYANLSSKNSSFRTGLRYQNKKGNYSLALLHGNHLINQRENGGITTDTLLGLDFYQERINIPVWLSAARFQYREIDYQIHQHFALAGKVEEDSLGRLLFSHRIRWEERWAKYSDTAPPVEQGYYGDLLTDVRGVRQYTKWQTFSNLAEALFSWRRSGGAAVAFTGGLEHRMHFTNNEWQDYNPQNLLLLGNLSLKWKESISAGGSTQIDLGSQVGTFFLEGYLRLKLKQWGGVQAGIMLNRRAPDYFQQQLVISSRPVYTLDPEPTQQQTVYGTLQLPGLKLLLGGAFHLHTNAIFFGPGGIPQTISGTVAQSHFWLNHQFKAGPFHLDQEIHLHTTADKRLPLPGLVSRHDLYYQNLLFRKTLLTRIGTEVHLISPWQPYAFIPIHSAFAVVDHPDTPWYPQVDAYVSIERFGFRFFVEMENMGRMIFNWKDTASDGRSIPRLFSQIQGYPQPDNWLRFGIAFTWRS